MTRQIQEPASGSLQWLLSLNGEDFINAAYEIILHRNPDPTGLDHYCRLLTRRKNKIRILSDLFSSRESRNWPQRNDVCEALFKYKHPLRWRLRKLFLTDEFYLRSGNGDVNYRPAAPPTPSAAPQPAALGEAVLGTVNRIQHQLLQLEYRLDSAEEKEADEILGDGKTRYFLNLSTSNHWRRHAVGIVRVERELAIYLRRFRNVDFVLWDSSSRSLKKLQGRQVKRILSAEWCDSNSRLEPYAPEHLVEPRFQRHDVYISLGLDWDHAPTDQLLKYLRPFGVKSVLACYDTVPVQFPEFLVREGLDQEFRKHFIEMAHGSDKVFAISKTSARDLRDFWESAKLESRVPDIFSVTLASNGDPAGLPILNDRDAATLRHVFGRGEYVLYVSSVEPRKNHRLLYDIWRDLWAERGAECPQLVHVGMAGWGSEDLLGRIPRMAAYKGGKINALYSIGDDLLAHLYHHCAFTVFPSVYEGWGLAATEALSFGKVCVIADNSSLPEATQGLMPAYHPFDFLGWKAEIEKLLDDTSYRQELENKISKFFVRSTWNDFGKSFCENLLLGR